jgi:hypothetical protein
MDVRIWLRHIALVVLAKSHLKVANELRAQMRFFYVLAMERLQTLYVMHTGLIGFKTTPSYIRMSRAREEAL